MHEEILKKESIVITEIIQLLLNNFGHICRKYEKKINNGMLICALSKFHLAGLYPIFQEMNIDDENYKILVEKIIESFKINLEKFTSFIKKDNFDVKK